MRLLSVLMALCFANVAFAQNAKQLLDEIVAEKSQASPKKQTLMEHILGPEEKNIQREIIVYPKDWKEKTKTRSKDGIIYAGPTVVDESGEVTQTIIYDISDLINVIPDFEGPESIVKQEKEDKSTFGKPTPAKKQRTKKDNLRDLMDLIDRILNN